MTLLGEVANVFRIKHFSRKQTTKAVSSNSHIGTEPSEPQALVKSALITMSVSSTIRIFMVRSNSSTHDELKSKKPGRQKRRCIRTLSSSPFRPISNHHHKSTPTIKSPNVSRHSPLSYITLLRLSPTQTPLKLSIPIFKQLKAFSTAVKPQFRFTVCSPSTMSSIPAHFLHKTPESTVLTRNMRGLSTTATPSEIPNLPVMNIPATASPITKGIILRKYIGKLQRHIAELRKHNAKLHSLSPTQPTPSILYDETVQHFFTQIYQVISDSFIDPTPRFQTEADFLLNSFPTSTHQFRQSEPYQFFLNQQHNQQSDEHDQDQISLNSHQPSIPPQLPPNSQPNTHPRASSDSISNLTSTPKQPTKPSLMSQEDFYLNSTLLQVFSMFNDLPRASLLALHLIKHCDSSGIVAIASTLKDIATALSRDGQYQLALYLVHVTHQYGIPNNKGSALALIAKQAQKHNDLAATSTILDIITTPVHHFLTKAQLAEELKQQERYDDTSDVESDSDSTPSQLHHSDEFVQSAQAQSSNVKSAANRRKPSNFRSITRNILDSDADSDDDGDQDLGEIEFEKDSGIAGSEADDSIPNTSSLPVRSKLASHELDAISNESTNVKDFFNTFLDKQAKKKEYQEHMRRLGRVASKLGTKRGLDDVESTALQNALEGDFGAGNDKTYFKTGLVFDEVVNIVYQSSKSILTHDIVDDLASIPIETEIASETPPVASVSPEGVQKKKRGRPPKNKASLGDPNTTHNPILNTKTSPPSPHPQPSQPLHRNPSQTHRAHNPQLQTDLVLAYKLKLIQSIFSSSLSTIVNSSLPHHAIQLLLIATPFLNGRSPLTLLSHRNFLPLTQEAPLHALLDALLPYIPQHLHQFQAMELLSVASKARHPKFAAQVYNSRLSVTESNYLLSTTSNPLSNDDDDDDDDITQGTTISDATETSSNINMSLLGTEPYATPPSHTMSSPKSHSRNAATHISPHTAPELLSQLPTTTTLSNLQKALGPKLPADEAGEEQMRGQIDINTHFFTNFVTSRFHLNALAPHFDQNTESILFTAPQFDPPPTLPHQHKGNRTDPATQPHLNPLTHHLHSLKRAGHRAYRRVFRPYDEESDIQAHHAQHKSLNPPDLSHYSLFPHHSISEITPTHSSSSSSQPDNATNKNSENPLYYSPQQLYLSRRLFYHSPKHFPPHYLHQHNASLYPETIQRQIELLQQDRSLNAIKYGFGSPSKVDFQSVPTLHWAFTKDSYGEQQFGVNVSLGEKFQQALSQLFYPPSNLFSLLPTSSSPSKRLDFHHDMTKHVPIYISPFLKQPATNPSDIAQLLNFVSQYPCFSYHINCILSPDHIHQSLTHDFHPEVISEQSKIHQLMTTTLIRSGHHRSGIKLWLTQLHAMTSISNVQPVVDLSEFDQHFQPHDQLSPPSSHPPFSPSSHNPTHLAYDTLREAFSQFHSELATQPAYWNLFPTLSALPADHSTHHSQLKQVYQGRFELHLKTNQNAEIASFAHTLFPSIFPDPNPPSTSPTPFSHRKSHHSNKQPKHQFTPLPLSLSSFNPIPYKPTHSLLTPLQVSTHFFNSLQDIISATSAPDNPQPNPSLSLHLWNLFSKGPNAQLMFSAQLPILTPAALHPFAKQLADSNIPLPSLTPSPISDSLAHPSSVPSSNKQTQSISPHIPSHFLPLTPTDPTSIFSFSSHLAATLNPVQLQHYQQYISQALSILPHSVTPILPPTTYVHSNYELSQLSSHESTHFRSKANIMQSLLSMLTQQATQSNKNIAETIAMFATILHPHAPILPMLYKPYRKLLAATEAVKLIQNAQTNQIGKKPPPIPQLIHAPINPTLPSALQHELVSPLISDHSRPFQHAEVIDVEQLFANQECGQTTDAKHKEQRNVQTLHAPLSLHSLQDITNSTRHRATIITTCSALIAINAISNLKPLIKHSFTFPASSTVLPSSVTVPIPHVLPFTPKPLLYYNISLSPSSQTDNTQSIQPHSTTTTSGFNDPSADVEVVTWASADQSGQSDVIDASFSGTSSLEIISDLTAPAEPPVSQHATHDRQTKQADLRYKVYQLKHSNSSLKATSIDPSRFSTALLQTFRQLFTQIESDQNFDDSSQPKLITPAKLHQYNLLLNTVMQLLSSDTFIYPSSHNYTTSFQLQQDSVVQSLQHFANYQTTLFQHVSPAIALQVSTAHKLIADPVAARLLTHVALIMGQTDLSQRIWDMHYFLTLDSREIWSSTSHLSANATKLNHSFQQQQIDKASQMRQKEIGQQELKTLQKSSKLPGSAASGEKVETIQINQHNTINEQPKRRRIVYAGDPEAVLDSEIREKMHLTINMNLPGQKDTSLKTAMTLTEWVSLTTPSNNSTSLSPRIALDRVLGVFAEGGADITSHPSYLSLKYYYSTPEFKALISEHTKQLLPFTKLNTAITTPDQLEYRLLAFLQDQLEQSEEIAKLTDDPKQGLAFKIPLVNGHIREHPRFIANRVPRWSSGKYEDEFLDEIIQSDEMQDRVVDCLIALGILTPGHKLKQPFMGENSTQRGVISKPKPRISIPIDGSALAAHFTKQSTNLLTALADQVKGSTDTHASENLFSILHAKMQQQQHELPPPSPPQQQQQLEQKHVFQRAKNQTQSSNKNGKTGLTPAVNISYPTLPITQRFDYNTMLTHEQKLYLLSESISIDPTFDARYYFKQFLTQFNPATLLYSTTSSLFQLHPLQRTIMRTMNYLTTSIHSGFPQLASLYLLKSITQQQFRHFIGNEVISKGHLATYRNSVQTHPLFFLAQHSITLMATTQPALAYQTYLMCEYFGLFQPFTDLSTLHFPTPNAASASSQPLQSEQSKIFSKSPGTKPPPPQPNQPVQSSQSKQAIDQAKSKLPLTTQTTQNTIFMRLLVQTLTGIPLFIDVHHLYPAPLMKKFTPQSSSQNAPPTYPTDRIIEFDKKLLSHSLESFHPLTKHIESPFLHRYLTAHPNLGSLGRSREIERSYLVSPKSVLAKPQHDLDLSTILIDNTLPLTDGQSVQAGHLGAQYAGIRLSDLSPTAKKTIGYNYLLALSSNPDTQLVFSHMQPNRWTESTTTAAVGANNFIIEDNMKKIQLKPVDNSENIGFHQYDYTPAYIYTDSSATPNVNLLPHLSDECNPLIRKLSAASGVSFSQMFIPASMNASQQKLSDNNLPSASPIITPTVQLDTSNMYHTVKMFAMKSVFDRNLQHLIRIPEDLQSEWQAFQASEILHNLTNPPSSPQPPNHPSSNPPSTQHPFFSIQTPFGVESIDPTQLNDIDRLVDLLHEYPVNTSSIPPSE